MGVNPFVCLGIDPGSRHLGWSVLTSTETLLAAGTMSAKPALAGLERHLWLMSGLQDLIIQYQPDMLAYEEFVWMAKDDEHYVVGRAGLERIIGGLQTLSLSPPYPVLMPLLPSVWGQQLMRQPSHTKAQIATIVNLRLGTTFKGDHYDNHQCDAVGIALVALDNLRHAGILQQRTRLPGKGATHGSAMA